MHKPCTSSHAFKAKCNINLLMICQGGGGKKVYGCPLPDEERKSAFPKEAEGFLFAPSDVKSWEFEGKDDMHGIGYRGIQEEGLLATRKSTKALYGMSGEVGVACITAYDLLACALSCGCGLYHMGM